jgi:hypothetical protein
LNADYAVVGYAVGSRFTAAGLTLEPLVRLFKGATVTVLLTHLHTAPASMLGPVCSQS